jgi:hypothetical protein
MSGFLAVFCGISEESSEEAARAYDQKATSHKA